MSSFPVTKEQKSARSSSEASSNASSPPSSIHMPGNNQVVANNNNAPKYGTLVPNRVFVGGIPSNTTEPELSQLFSKYGNVKATKIIADRAGVSKGYGFVTFETEEEAKRLQSDADNIVLRERRLNIAPAVKKQSFSRVFESATSPPPATPSLYYHNGMPYTFHNGMAYFPQTPNQGAAALPTPELPVYQGGGFGPQNNAQSYGPPMMYPCGANPGTTMFISPQPYNPYPHMPVPTQGPPPLMYTGGPNPSNNQANNTTPENTQSVQMATGPPAPYYLPPAMTQTPEIYYNLQPAPSQSCYGPIVALASHDGVMHYCDVPVEQGNSNLTSEDISVAPIQDQSLVSHPPTENCGNNSTIQYRNEVGETPVVSLLSLQDDETHNNKVIKMGHSGKQEQVDFVPDTRQHIGYASNATSYQITKNRKNKDFQKFPGEKETSNFGRGRGTLRGRGVRYFNNNPRTPHDNNNNHNHGYTEKQEDGDYRTDIATRGMKFVRGGRSRGGNMNRGVKRGSLPLNFPPQSLSPSLPVLPMSAHNTHPRFPRPSHNNLYNYPNFKNTPLQMQQQVYHQRNYQNPYYSPYTPVHQQVPPPPPPPPIVPPPQQSRRYGNGSKKPTNGAINSHMTGSRKLKTVEGMDSGAAGDGPVPNMVALSPPSSPGTNSKQPATGTTDICAHMQAMSL